MRVKCELCDRIDELDDDSPFAKKLRNRPIHTYLCPECNERIARKTKERRNHSYNKQKNRERITEKKGDAHGS